MKETAQDIKQLYNELQNHKQGFLSFYKDVEDYITINHPRVMGGDMPGTARSTDIVFDSSPILMSNRLSAALMSMLTSPSSKWFGLTVNDKRLMNMQAVKEWLVRVEDVIRESLDNSNFYQEIYKIYVDLVNYGTACLYVKPSNRADKELNFSARPIGEYVVTENEEGIIDTVIRKFEFTARQMIMEFGKRYVSKEVKEAYEEKPETKFEVLHCVYPRENVKPNKMNKANKPIASVWIQYAEEKVLRKDGYNSFPFVVPRWVTHAGEMYGRSPVYVAMPDIKTLNEAMKTLLKSAQKIADPLWSCPDEGVGDMTQEPGGVIYYDAMTSAKPEPYSLGGDLPITNQIVEKIRENIGNVFYANQLHMIQSDRMTAEEVRIRAGENSRILGPTFGMLNYEMLGPLIERVLDILSKSLDTDGNPMLPTPPAELADKELKLTFTSPMAKSQKYHEAQSVLYTAQSAIEWSQIIPTVLDNVNWDEAIRLVGDSNGTPPTVFLDKEVVENVRQVRANQQRAMQEAQLNEQQAETAKKGTQALKNASSAEKTLRSD